MGTWKTPGREVWWTVECSRCRKIINRVKLPGLIRQKRYQVCRECTAGAPVESSPFLATP